MAGQRTQESAKGHGPLRLITVTEEAEAGNPAQNKVRWVNLIHETLIRSKNASGEGKPQPYRPTLWQYIEQHKDQAAQHEYLELLARQWRERTGLARLFGLVGWWDWLSFRKLAARSSLERIYLRWSAARASVNLFILILLLNIVGESAWWVLKNGLTPDMMWTQQRFRLGYAPLPELSEKPIPTGSFKMGEQDAEFIAMYGEYGQHFGVPGKSIQIEQPYHLGKYEVTYVQFDYYVWQQQRAGNETITFPANAAGGRDDRPVANVNWHEATAYAVWLGEQTGQTCRLPTEAEWEYAARAGTQTAYPWGDDLGKNNANCDGCGSAWDGKMAAPVGSFPANSFGLHDMSGNVWEWTCSAWREHFDGEEQQCAERESTEARVVRGGSWFFSLGSARSASRHYYDPDYRYYYVGFRVLCSSPIND